jgi:uncharacterized coiled-coil DUF342 family protein
MAYIFISEKKLQSLVATAVKTQMQNLLWGWDGETEIPGLYREFDSVHARINSLERKVNEMQSRIDDFRALIAALGAKIDEWKARPEGIPVETFDALADELRAVLAKFG